MATFAQWLADQRKRQDAVGWFARYWRDLPGTPRLSSPSSIGSHLEDRETGGFRDQAVALADGTTCSGDQLRQAYDATLKEYRQVRAQIVQDAASGSGAPAPPGAGRAGPDVAPEPPRGPAGEAVARASAAGLAAAQAHQGPLRARMGTGELLEAVYRKLERIEAFLGLPDDEDLAWAEWYELADLTARADG